MQYLNRDISWLSFNQRVSDEADKDIPLAERVLFHGIAFSNLEEFMMVRYPAAVEFNSVDSMDILHEKIVKHHDLLTSRFERFNDMNQIIEPFRNVGMFGSSAEWLKKYFGRNVFSALQPITIQEGRSITVRTPIAIYVETMDDKDQEYANYIEIPTSLDRFIRITNSNSYVLLDDLIMDNLNMLFKGMKILTACAFSTIRSAEVYIKDDSLKDPYEIIQRTLLERNKAWITRLEIGTDKKGVIRRLKEHLNITDNTLVCSSKYVHLGDLKRIGDDIFEKEDHRRVLKPVSPFSSGNIFDLIRRSDRLVFHPYESYEETVVKFIRESSEDPDVISIKITLYRVADKSRIIDSLVRAASEGKQVTVLVELKARFDEKHNIQMADILKEAGVNLVYGSLDLKTHAKVCIVTRKEHDRLRIYSHVGTGNYNESTSRTYADYSYFTADMDTGYDLTRFFSLLTSEQEKFKSRKIIYAPYNLRSTINDHIDQEIEEAKKGNKASIIIKCNSLTDDKIANKLVEASDSGVVVTLIVRGACILQPTKRIRIYSIVGRFLEHSRIYLFGERKRQAVYIGSSDIMHRNLNRRNELMIRIDTPELKKRILSHLELYQTDTVNRRIIEEDYKYRDVTSIQIIDCQSEFIKEAKKRAD